MKKKYTPREPARRKKKYEPRVKTPLSVMADSLVKARYGVPVEAGRDTKARRAMDRMLADMDRNAGKKPASPAPTPPPFDDRRYDPKLGYKPGQSKFRIVVEDCKFPCEECLNRIAWIYSIDFSKNLCLDCEEKLMMEVAGRAFDRYKKKLKKGRP